MSVVELVSGRTSTEPSGWVDLREDGPRTVITLRGEVDIRLCGKLASAVGLALALGRPVDVDTREVTVVDSSVMGQIARLAYAETHDVRLLAPPPLVRELLEVTDLAGAVTVVEPA